jgi:hypothetical protein
MTVLIFPTIYYITSPEFYYRRPIDPLLLTLAVSAAKTDKNKPRMERI